jgi:hypothetical protein
LITTAVVAVPHLAGNLISAPPSPPPPLAIVGSASPVQPTDSAADGQGAEYSGALGGTSGADPCSLSGTYVVPGAVHLPQTVSTEDIARMLEKAGYANETSGSYLLQSSAGQTAVLTGLHTVLLRRVPASTEKATVLYVESLCPGAPLTMYDASIDLDAANLTPRLSLINEMSGTTTPVRNLADVTTEDQPVQINFNATTTKYDVTWKLRVDYVVNGKAESAYVPPAGQPFETDAVVSSDPAYTLWLNGSDAWSVQSGNPSTPPSPTTPSPVPTASGAAVGQVPIALHYSCPLPIVGGTDLAATFTWPSGLRTATVGTPTPSLPVEVAAAFASAARTLVSSASIKWIEGTANVSAEIMAPQGDISENVQLTVPRTNVSTGSGPLTVPASGPIPSVLLTQPGQAKVVVGAMVIHLATLTASGAPSFLGNISTSCTLDSGQADIVAPVQILP